MVKILNGEIVQDDDPRLPQQQKQQQPQARQRPVGRIRHDTSSQGQGGEEGGGLLGTGFDLSAYLGNNSEPVFTSPPVTLPGGREIPAVDFTLERLFILAVCYGTPSPGPPSATPSRPAAAALQTLTRRPCRRSAGGAAGAAGGLLHLGPDAALGRPGHRHQRGGRRCPHAGPGWHGRGRERRRGGQASWFAAALGGGGHGGGAEARGGGGGRAQPVAAAVAAGLTRLSRPSRGVAQCKVLLMDRVEGPRPGCENAAVWIDTRTERETTAVPERASSRRHPRRATQA